METTTTVKHTPGPWTTGDSDWRTIVGGVTRFRTDDDGGRHLVAVAVLETSDNEAEDLANARLIKAGPDLLEVAQAMCEAIPAHGAWSPKLRDHLYAVASAAVRKAGRHPGGMVES